MYPLQKRAANLQGAVNARTNFAPNDGMCQM